MKLRIWIMFWVFFAPLIAGAEDPMPMEVPQTNERPGVVPPQPAVPMSPQDISEHRDSTSRDTPNSASSGRWLSQATEPMGLSHYSYFIGNDSGRAFRGVSLQDFNDSANKPADVALVRQALQLTLQKDPQVVRQWMSSVDHIAVVDGARLGIGNPQAASFTVKSSRPEGGVETQTVTVLVVPREHLTGKGASPLLTGETPQMRTALTIGHEARHAWQDKTEASGGALPYTQKNNVQREADAYRWTGSLARSLGYDNHTVALQLFIGNNAGKGNVILDRFITGETLTPAEQRSIQDLFKKVVP